MRLTSYMLFKSTIDIFNLICFIEIFQTIENYINYNLQVVCGFIRSKLRKSIHLKETCRKRLCYDYYNT
jgi:hypothetical protein